MCERDQSTKVRGAYYITTCKSLSRALKCWTRFSPPAWRCRQQACGRWYCTPWCWCMSPAWSSGGTPHPPPAAWVASCPVLPHFHLARQGAKIWVGAATGSCRSRQVYASYHWLQMMDGQRAERQDSVSGLINSLKLGTRMLWGKWLGVGWNGGGNMLRYMMLTQNKLQHMFKAFIYQIIIASVVSLSTPVYASGRKFRSVCLGKDKCITFHWISCHFVEWNQTDGCISWWYSRYI